MSQLIPSAVSLRIAETEQFYQAQGMIGGIGNVLLSRPVLKLQTGKNQGFLSVNLSEARDDHTCVNFGKQNCR